MKNLSLVANGDSLSHKKRNFPRINIRVPITIKAPLLNKKDLFVAETTTLDLGEQGLSFYLPDPLPPTTEFLKISLKLPDMEEQLHIETQLTDCNENHRIYRVKFLNLKDRAASTIASYIDDRVENALQEERRKNERRHETVASKNRLWRTEILIRKLEKALLHRVVVTGLGPITPIGIGVKNFWDSLEEGKNGIRPITFFDTSSLPCKIAAEVKNFDPLQFLSKNLAKRMDRFSQMGIAGTALALDDAKLKVSRHHSDHMGVLIGTSSAGLTFAERQLEIFKSMGFKKIDPFSVSSIITSNCASQIAISFGITGPTFSLSTACASGTDAIGTAFQMIRRGELKIAVAGSAEALLTPFAISCFYAAGILSNRNDNPSEACRPFDKERDGSVIGEGAGILVMERLDHAIERGAPIYAEIIGYGRSTDAFHPIRQLPSGSKAVAAINNALKDAGVSPHDVDHINAHGSSTVLNDKLETQIFKKVFGPHAHKLTISATKSMIGHLQGGCGGPETIACALSVKNNMAHPTINLTTPDLDCDLDYVPNKKRHQEIKIALKNSFGFGGKNAALVIKKFNPLDE